MWKALILATALSFSTGANALDICAFADPPDRYEYVPDKPVILHVVKDMNIIRKACGHGADMNAWGCTLTYEKLGVYEVFVLDTGNVKEMNCILTHEYAHVNGWPSNHPK